MISELRREPFLPPWIVELLWQLHMIRNSWDWEELPAFQCKDIKLCFIGILQCFIQTYPKTPSNMKSLWKTIWQPSNFHLKKKYTQKAWFCCFPSFQLHNAGWFKPLQTFVLCVRLQQPSLKEIYDCLLISMQTICTFQWPRACRLLSCFLAGLTKPLLLQPNKVLKHVHRLSRYVFPLSKPPSRAVKGVVNQRYSSCTLS